MVRVDIEPLILNLKTKTLVMQLFTRKCAYKISRLESELITNVPKHITVINTTV